MATKTEGCHTVSQRCPTGGPRAASGPPSLPIWPASARR